MMGTSVKGLKRCLISSSITFAVFVFLSIKSHLLTRITIPLLLLFLYCYYDIDSHEQGLLPNVQILSNVTIRVREFSRGYTNSAARGACSHQCTNSSKSICPSPLLSMPEIILIASSRVHLAKVSSSVTCNLTHQDTRRDQNI